MSRRRRRSEWNLHDTLELREVSQTRRIDGAARLVAPIINGVNTVTHAPATAS